jgi:putative molybdopterin biosynthesis protein
MIGIALAPSFGIISRSCQWIERAQKYAYRCRMEFLTTSEAADYLRLGERKLYELVTVGAIPCSKVTGKWLFPRHELDLWVLSGLARPAGMTAVEPPPIMGGSQDDLLEWSLRESGSGLASLTEGTMRGVERLQRGEVLAAAVHFHGDDLSANGAGDANIAALRALPGLHDAVLVGVARRERARARARQPQGSAGPAGRAGVRRQDRCQATRRGRTAAVGGAAQTSWRERQGSASTRATLSHRSRSRSRDPHGERRLRHCNPRCGESAGLDFVPLIWESFDLLTRQRSYFRPAIQTLAAFLRDKRLAQRAAELTGYDTAPAGQIRFSA